MPPSFGPVLKSKAGAITGLLHVSISEYLFKKGFTAELCKLLLAILRGLRSLVPSEVSPQVGLEGLQQ